MDSENKKSGHILKTALVMVIITLSAKVLGMLRDILLASAYGTSPEAVAYDTASRLPLIIFDFVIGGVVTASFIPVFNEVMVKKGKKDAFRFAGDYFNLILSVTAAICALGIVLAEPLVSLLAPDIASETAALAVSLTRIMFPMIIFTGLAFSFVGFLQSLGSFLLPALISLVSNLIMVAHFLFFNERFGIYGLAIAMLVGWGAQALIQLPSVLRKGFRFSLGFDLRSEYIKKALIMALPILISSWVQPFCNLINTRFASSIEGGISAMGYASRLYLIIVGVFTFVATNLLFPYFSKATAGGDKDADEKLTRSSVKVLQLVILPITVGIFVLSEGMVALIYQRGEFTAADTVMTASALRFFAVGMPFYALNEVLTKKFFAEQRTVTPMVTALVSIGFNFALVSFLASRFGLAGLALSSAVAVALNSFINLFVRLHRGDKVLALTDLISLLKMLASALLMGVGIKYLSLYFGDGALGLALSVLCGAAIYFLLCLLLREATVTQFISSAFGRRRK